jgi:hypothetical protein
LGAAGAAGAAFPEAKLPDGRKRWRAPVENKNEREAKKMLMSSLVKGQKVWVFNSKELWPLNSARKLKAIQLAGADASKVAVGRIPPQIGELLSDAVKGWWDVLLHYTDDRIKCRLVNLQIYEAGSAPPMHAGI